MPRHRHTPTAPPPQPRPSGRQRQIEHHLQTLRKQFGTGRNRKSPVPFPDLACTNSDGRAAAALSNTMCPVSTAPRVLPSDAMQFPVGNSHKQGPMLITPGAIANGELQYMSGKKS